MPRSYLNRTRYAQNDETLYVAPEDERTDYVRCHRPLVSPPRVLTKRSVSTTNGELVCGRFEVSISCFETSSDLTFPSTGKRRYGHPALNGVLPQPWLPLKKGQSMSNGGGVVHNGEAKETVILTLRKRYSRARPPISNGVQPRVSSVERTPAQDIPDPTGNEAISNPWQDTTPGPSNRSGGHHHQLSHRLSFDAATGVIMLPENDDWIAEEESDSDQDYGTPRGQGDLIQDVDLEQSWSGDTANGLTQSPTKRYKTYYHHPERRKRT